QEDASQSCGGEDGDRGEEEAGLGERLKAYRFAIHASNPAPSAVGSASQSGGVSHTNARIAVTHRSYGSVARSSVQNNARVSTPATPSRDGIGLLFRTR